MHTSNRVGVSNITEYISHFVTLHCLRKLERFRNPDNGKLCIIVVVATTLSSVLHEGNNSSVNDSRSPLQDENESH